MASTQTYITFENFDINRMQAKPFEKKKIPNNRPGTADQFYYEIALEYNYGLDGENAINIFMIEGPEVTCNSGLTERVAPDGKIGYSLGARLELANTDHMKFAEALEKIYYKSAEFLEKDKVAVNKKFFSAKTPEASEYKSPVFKPFDKNTGVTLEGRDYLLSLKCFRRGQPPRCYETLFTDLKGQRIPWALLKGCRITLIPLLTVKRIFIGSVLSLQIELTSAVITGIAAVGSTTQQTATLRRLQEQNPDLVDAVAAQLAKLTTERQDQLLGSTCVTTATDSEETPEETPKATMTPIQPEPTSKIVVPDLKGFLSSAPISFN